MNKPNLFLGFSLIVLSLILVSCITNVGINYTIFEKPEKGKKITQDLQLVLGKKDQSSIIKKTAIKTREDGRSLAYSSLGKKNDSRTSSMVKAWTYMLYLDADNDLERDALWDFEELEQAGGTNEDINVIVLFDRIPGYESSHGDWTGSRIYQVTADVSPITIDSVLLEDLGEVNMGNPETLSNFLEYCFQHFPAENYCLDLWDHGWGVYGLCPDETSIFGETTEGESLALTINAVQSVITNVTTTYSTNLDVISMDACEMNTLEVAWELRDSCDYFIASEGTVNWEAYNYSAIIQKLHENPALSPQALCEFMVEDYQNYYTTTRSPSSLSVIDQGKIKEILPVMNNFVKEMISALSTPNYWFLFALARRYTQEFGPGTGDLIWYTGTWVTGTWCD
ncbi:MAG: clostripain-related cysteine peptidase, partial [Candidatus Hodarchaeota archaeon]